MIEDDSDNVKKFVRFFFFYYGLCNLPSEVGVFNTGDCRRYTPNRKHIFKQFVIVRTSALQHRKALTHQIKIGVCQGAEKSQVASVGFP